MSSLFHHELAIACLAAREAGRTAHEMQAGIAATDKADGSPVTPGDLAADQIIRHLLEAHFPGDAILSEEVADSAARLDHARVWIIDPIDGTKDYLAGGTGWAVQIALAVDGVLVLGVLDMPGLGTQLAGIPGQGATIVDADGARALVASATPCTTLIASSSSRNAESLVRIRAALPEFACTTCTSVGVKVHHILQGDADLYVHARQIHEWDVAAPAAVLAAAGGTATALAGEPLRYNSNAGRCPGLVFSTRPDHAAVVQRLAHAGLPRP
jgi:3'-phosphoadenosine 5'-phosphosulfate (PAPS) 3'-phosphatase